MEKPLSVLLVLFFLSSCCYKGAVNSLGRPRTKMTVKELANNDIYKSIDTTSIYELIYFISNMDVIIPNDTTHSRTYYQFFANGKVGEFSLGYDSKNYKTIPNYKMNRDDFNPKRFRMGYFYTDDGKIKMKQFGTKFCSKNYYYSTIKISGDTITEYFGKSSTSSTRVYIKEKIDYSLIEGWNPDW